MNVRSVFLILAVLALASCIGSHNPAPVTNYYQSSGPGSAGVHNVRSGDTLYTISNNYNLAMRDIAAVNNLRPPFRLFEGQRLKLPPPREYRVQYGDSLYSVSRLFEVNSSEIAKLNNLNAPYTIRAGQVLRLPAVTQKTAPQKFASKQKPVAKSPVQKTPVTAQKSTAGMPIPQEKPATYQTVSKSSPQKISRVVTKTPRRSSSKFLRPVNGEVISKYGAKKNGLHNDGINIKANRGTSVMAAENGVVVYAGNALKGSGNLVLLRHDDQWMTAYAHLDSYNIRKGQVVKRGQSIGSVGSTGSVKSSQLHFEIRRGTQAVNPERYIE